MQGQYYKLPLDLSRILQKKDMPVCNLEESVSQHIHLLITTVLGENKDDPQYGCQLWDSDFDIKASNNEVKEQVENAVRTAIVRYEKRLAQIKVMAVVSQEELGMTNGRKVKKKIKVNVTGTLAKNNNPFHYSSYFYVSPLSFD
ncbi:GPW/gp25 family protein [Chitinophaga agrisoli]|uniref:GPW/gp25 family protein n=1 Tax=Chitinophaga agrisoli TaxID=2607653 RepID=A0A5B2VYU2_9BACT|nr:GPW/gp25 family protein [Chitinophaga agrisoli]KAA2243720.1 GPW/gp25 family protein [Chitinophaga agrisoli]